MEWFRQLNRHPFTIDSICLHAYTKTMKSIQYTIRGIPVEVDARLRRLARLRGQSLNQIVIERLTVDDNVTKKPSGKPKKYVNHDFDDLFDQMTPLEPEVEEALRAQRVVHPKDWQ